MKTKILNHIKKVGITSMVIILFSTNVTYAFSNPMNKGEKTGRISDFFSRIFNRDNEEEKKQEYSLEKFKTDLEAMKKSGNISLTEITALIDKLPEGNDKMQLEGIQDMFAKIMEKLEGVDISTLLEKLVNTLLEALEGITGGLGGLIGGNTSSALPVQAESIYMDAKTAVEFGGTDAVAKLHANVYMHVDENGNEDSDKWALLIHPFMLDGTSIADNVGPFYYEKGYNIIAPDLRGFGDSEGSVALGCLESMDIYDWLVKLNAEDEYKVSQVIVHGISLGAATTNYLSGIDGFINNGPTKIDSKIKSIKELNVIGLVEDCGYVDMTEFANESTVKSYSGIKENFDYYSKATNSLKYCEVPMMIIHGTSDSTVKPENAEEIRKILAENNVPVKVHMVEGGVHAFIIMGNNKEEYKEFIHSFIENCTKLEKNNVAQNKSVKDEKTVDFKIYVNNDKNFVETVRRLLNKRK